ncbi:hypothetical protein CYMTET_21981 [Cymbomonas tetramitiformis]|uniref:DNA replication licensing factor MCM4 n=1 Tax=Cymbomonas tetramitiformis TaxID=36881 RepID=A0AAE0L2R4_9CHLO|nr:hypothetical protein CYMTET_21981 [Cymbomonas tetramitiformis]
MSQSSPHPTAQSPATNAGTPATVPGSQPSPPMRDPVYTTTPSSSRGGSGQGGSRRAQSSSPFNFSSEPPTPASHRTVNTPRSRATTPGSRFGTPNSQKNAGRFSTPASNRGPRGDLQGSQRRRARSRARSVEQGSTPAPGEEKTEDASDVEATFVWGTTVSVNDCRQRVRRFIQNFAKDGGQDPFYVEVIKQILAGELNDFNLDCTNLHEYDPDLYKQLILYPQELIPIFDIEVNALAAAAGMDDAEARIQVRTYNLISPKHMRDLNPCDIDTMVSIRGMVTRASGILPDLRSAFFKCLMCGQSPEMQSVDRGRISEPSVCPRPQCAAKFAMQLVHNRCGFANRQQVKMQETPDEMPDGETPHTVNLCLFENIVDAAKPGDRIEVTGIYRAVPIRVAPNQRSLKAIYKTYLDVIHIRKDSDQRLRSERSKTSEPSGAAGMEGADLFTPERVAEMLQLAQDPAVYDKLSASLAPSIYEMDDVKKGILCQLFGGANRDGAGTTGNGKFRGEINVLLVGDPGVSKSQLLTYVHKIAPRGIYTSGRGSSAVGLTAYVTKDPESKEMVLESGALVLSDRGICCIDEFDKMSENARSMLHEVMEQQTVSVAKAGIICTLNARTSVLASANPVGSRFNPSLSVVENIQLPPTLMSRFDLIYLVLDKVHEESDRRLAKHLVALHFRAPPARQEGALSRELFTDYISYARHNIHPLLSDEAQQELMEGYVEMRKAGAGKKVIAATPRQLESCIRLAEALARMRLSAEVGSADVAEAMRLMKAAMRQSATDPKTGMIDYDMITSGVSSSERLRRRQLAEGIKHLLQEEATLDRVSKVPAEVKSRTGMDVTLQEVQAALGLLREEGICTVSGDAITVMRI